MATITAIQGLADTYAERLRDHGVRTTDALLDAGGTRSGRKELADAVGVGEKRILEWVNQADLMRVKGVSAQLAELLEEVGVGTIKELRRRNAENLAEALETKNSRKRKNALKRTPSAATVQKWVDQAKDLDPVVKH